MMKDKSLILNATWGAYLFGIFLIFSAKIIEQGMPVYSALRSAVQLDFINVLISILTVFMGALLGNQLYYRFYLKYRKPNDRTHSSFVTNIAMIFAISIECYLGNSNIYSNVAVYGIIISVLGIMCCIQNK